MSVMFSKSIVFVAGILLTVVWPQTHAQDKSKKKTKPPSQPSIVWVNQPKDNQLPLPKNTRHLTFRSTLVNKDIGYCIYLPPSYASSTKTRYPVIYNLHGNGGNEFTSVDSIRVLHDGIKAGRWPELIMVLPNGGHSTFYKNSADGRFPIESIFITEFIPFIDKTYRTVAVSKGFRWEAEVPHGWPSSIRRCSAACSARPAMCRTC
ncbi:MAG: alpha/beta hydrolase-fold protein [Fuerstiella sp.]